MISLFPSLLFLLPSLVTFSNAQDAAGYFLPSSGQASTTQFLIGPEFSGGTACGLISLPGGSGLSGGAIGRGGGPGLLYAAINQLAFGANPSGGAGGPGGACGVCYTLTPVSTTGTVLTAQSLTFKIVDECPAAAALSGGPHCSQCSLSDVNDFGKTFHFDLAVDAMTQAQYDFFFEGVPDGTNWPTVNFVESSCDNAGLNADGDIASFGCLENCVNNDSAGVCAGV